MWTPPAAQLKPKSAPRWGAVVSVLHLQQAAIARDQLLLSSSQGDLQRTAGEQAGADGGLALTLELDKGVGGRLGDQPQRQTGRTVAEREAAPRTGLVPHRLHAKASQVGDRAVEAQQLVAQVQVAGQRPTPAEPAAGDLAARVDALERLRREQEPARARDVAHAVAREDAGQ